METFLLIDNKMSLIFKGQNLKEAAYSRSHIVSKHQNESILSCMHLIFKRSKAHKD